MKTTVVFFNYDSPEDSGLQPIAGLRGEKPAFCHIPDSCIIRSGKPFFTPDFDDNIRLAPALAIRIDRLGKRIAYRFAKRYYDEVAPAFLAIACGHLTEARNLSFPWTDAVCFDRSLIIGDYVPFDTLGDNNGTYTFDTIMSDSSRTTHSWRLDAMRLDIDSLIEHISLENTLKTGDIILAGVSHQAVPLKGDIVCVEARVGDKLLLKTKIR